MFHPLKSFWLWRYSESFKLFHLISLWRTVLNALWRYAPLIPYTSLHLPNVFSSSAFLYPLHLFMFISNINYLIPCFLLLHNISSSHKLAIVLWFLWTQRMWNLEYIGYILWNYRSLYTCVSNEHLFDKGNTPEFLENRTLT